MEEGEQYAIETFGRYACVLTIGPGRVLCLLRTVSLPLLSLCLLLCLLLLCCVLVVWAILCAINISAPVVAWCTRTWSAATTCAPSTPSTSRYGLFTAPTPPPPSSPVGCTRVYLTCNRVVIYFVSPLPSLYGLFHSWHIVIDVDSLQSHGTASTRGAKLLLNTIEKNFSTLAFCCRWLDRLDEVSLSVGVPQYSVLQEKGTEIERRK